ncbi:ribonuclease R [Campylobacter pinnipediorum subsp. caledonicus]|uniref:Ribonuclease R n=1 Tax=Campylobacter pinnipediorum subsp. caledonicus TaxID=1874362 RepID=A0A1S6U972_9BACT|nr:ribonuclease R family protein [Campylobacter pinnipediorum]AQW88283.1 ribonuclease R [Campylobacter pinnipediorum subsp. caledonicus]
MKQFLTSLANGICQKEVSNQDLETLRVLTNLKAVCEHNNKFYINNGFVCGRLDISSGGTGFITPFDNNFKEDILVENKNLNGSNLGDIVLAKIIKGKRKRQSAKVVISLKLANETSLVYTKFFKSAVLGVNIKTGLNITLKASQKSLRALPPGTILKINNHNGEITEVIGNINNPMSDEKISLSIYNKSDNFTQECENEANAWGDEVDPNMYPDRINLENFDFCTIDPVDAKDFDDAIYFDEKNMQIYVAIADVSEYVNTYNNIDTEAKKRGFSIYFPHKSVPMLPRNLSENICSLKPNVYRLAFCFKISLDKNCEVIKEELFNAIIKSKKRFNYDEIDEILQDKKDSPISWIKPLHKITSKLRKKRLENAFDFRTTELRIGLNEDGDISSTHFETDSVSHQLVEDCMLLANKAAAKKIKNGIFRNHGKPDLRKIYNLLDELALLGLEFAYENDLVKLIKKIQAKSHSLPNYEEIDKLIIRAQKKAEYSSQNLGHFGLGFDRYTHFTSPIRRYSDLILHRLLKATIKNDEKLYRYLLLNIEDTCQNLSELEREADKVAYDFIDRKFARWANENIGNTFKCYVCENKNILIARLDDKLKGARIFIPSYTAPLLSYVNVKITEVDIPSAKIFGKVLKA